MPKPILTISIPTYNRASYLDFLLTVLARELRGLEDHVRVFVSDNASTDATADVVDRHRVALGKALVDQRNAQNLGADRNIQSCFELCETPYVWVMGDDDVPLTGAVKQLVDMLEAQRPDMVYLPSIGSQDVARDHALHASGPVSWCDLTREEFASTVHVQFTFISGLVLRKDAASTASIQQALARTHETRLVQLAWTFEILNQGARFIFARSPMLLATAGNSGGYAVLEVFLVNHTRIVESLLAGHPEVVARILARTSACFVPGLIWNIRKKTMGRFDLPPIEGVAVPPALARLASFRWLVVPIWRFPEPIALLFYQLSRVINRLIRAYDQLVVLRAAPRIDATRGASR